MLLLYSLDPGTDGSSLPLPMLVKVMPTVLWNSNSGRTRPVYLLRSHTLRHTVAVRKPVQIHGSVGPSHSRQVHPLKLGGFLPLAATAVGIAVAGDGLGAAVPRGLTSAIFNTS